MEQHKHLLAACLSVGVKQVFNFHVYTFAGLPYLHMVGGEIGLRLTSIYARMIIAKCVREIKAISRLQG